MKKIFTFLSAAVATVFFSTAFAQQIPNPGFENPAGTDSIHATSWHTTDTITSTMSVYPFYRTSNSHSGNRAAKLETKTVLTLAAPGIATLGTLTMGIGGLTVSGGIPFTYRPDTLKGFYKHPVSVTDTAIIAIGLFKWNVGLAKRDTVGSAEAIYTTQVNAYTSFWIKINYLSGATPDTKNIAMISSTSHVGSLFYVDDLSFGYVGGMGIQPVVKNSDNFSVYPNPSSSFVNINTDFNNGNLTTVKVYNVLGKEMYSTANSLKKQTIDVSEYPVGLYFVEAINNGQKHIRKITVNK